MKGTGVKLQLRVRQGRHDDAARHAAFADLHREHALGVYNLAVRLVGDREEAQDISQDVLLKAFERLGKPGELHQRAWLYRVTVNACYDHLRTLRRRPRAADERCELTSPVDGFEQAELVHAVEATLRRLPPAQRAALLLREVHGLPTGEVAFALGTTPDSAAVTLSRARKTFRRHFLALHGPAAPPVAAEAGTAGRDPGGVTRRAGALALGLWLPRLHLPQTPLPAGLESPALLSAASTSVGLSSGHGDAAVGIMARLADALSTKLGTVGASATLITGSIGGAYAVEHAARTSPPVPPATSPQAQATATAPAAKPPAAGARPSASPVPSVATAAVPSPTGSPAATASPTATAPSSTPTPLTVGETGESATPTPEPSAEPSATPAPTPTASASPEPSTSPTAEPSPTASP